MDCLINTIIQWPGDSSAIEGPYNKYLSKETTISGVPPADADFIVDGYKFELTDTRHEVLQEFIEVYCYYKTVYLDNYYTTITGLEAVGWTETEQGDQYVKKL